MTLKVEVPFGMVTTAVGTYQSSVIAMRLQKVRNQAAASSGGGAEHFVATWAAQRRHGRFIGCVTALIFRFATSVSCSLGVETMMLYVMNLQVVLA